MSELAAGLPVSRPAVSRHLTVLRRNGLVRYEDVGTRNVYRPRPDRTWRAQGVASLWETILDRYAEQVREDSRAKPRHQREEHLDARQPDLD